MKWILLIYRLPSEPSRHRVFVWRQIRKLGALSVKQSACALPSSEGNLAGLTALAKSIQRVGGDSYLFSAEALDKSTAALLESSYSKAVQEEYVEYLSECAKFIAEIKKEIKIKKFTHAELAEEEKSLEKLQRWSQDLTNKDLFGSPSRSAADRALKECDAALERFAAKVLAAEERR